MACHTAQHDIRGVIVAARPILTPAALEAKPSASGGAPGAFGQIINANLYLVNYPHKDTQYKMLPFL